MTAEKPHAIIAERYRRHIRRIREKQGLSQSGLAAVMGTSPAYLADLETGRRQPSLYMIEKTARALDVDIVELIKEGA